MTGIVIEPVWPLRAPRVGCAAVLVGRATVRGARAGVVVRPARALRRGTARGTWPAAACRSTSSARCRVDEHDVARRQPGHLERSVVDRVADVVELAGRVGRSHLGDHHHGLLALVALHAEGDDVAGADTVEHPDGALDVLGEHVAATDDDHVLDPAAQHQLAVEQVRQVAGAQPPVVEQRRGGVVALVVAGRDRGPAQQQLADVTLRELLEGLGIDDAHLQAGDRSAEQRQPPHPVGEVVGIDDLDRLGDALGSSTMRSTSSVTSPRPRVGNDPPIATSAIPNAGNTAPRRSRTDSLRRRTLPPLSDRPARRRTGPSVSVDRSISPSAIRFIARVASTQEKFGPAVAVPPVSRDPAHPVAGVTEEVLRRSLDEVDTAVIGIERKPTNPMSWYSGSHETITSPAPSSAASQQASRLARTPDRGSSHLSARSSIRSCTAGSRGGRGRARAPRSVGLRPGLRGAGHHGRHRQVGGSPSAAS